MVLTGTTSPGARIDLIQAALDTVADNQGAFAFSAIPLALGNNNFTVRATDVAGNSAEFSQTITRTEIPGGGDTILPQLNAVLATDTGSSALDGITSSASIAGTVSDNVAVVSLLAGFDATPAAQYREIVSHVTSNGQFVLDLARLESIFGGTLTDGGHTLHLQAFDAAGNASAQIDVAFTLDTAAPAQPAFDLAITSDSGTVGDHVTNAANVALVGSSDPAASISLVGTSISALANNLGNFQLAGIALQDGANVLTLRASDAAGNTSERSLTIQRSGEVTQDQALFWNHQALEAIRLDVTDPSIATRRLAMVSLAIYDSLAAIDGTQAYLVKRSVEGPVSADAAVAAAAYRILSAEYAGQKTSLDAALADSLAKVAEGSAKDAGIALGAAVADAILALRGNDGSDAFVDYPGSTELGKWRPTGPMFDVAEQPNWANVTPFALTSPGEFRPAPPPALDSVAYAQSVEEVRSVGNATSTTRTADQTQQAQFWADGTGSYTPPGHWNQIAEEIAKTQGNSLSANARLFAMLNVGLADAAIACWDSKYTYGLWRPETAIANADVDNNAATIKQEGWTPLLITPPHPEYVSGHSTFSSAAARILGHVFGMDTSFSTTAYTLPGVTRSFDSFDAAADEAGRSRVYGGIHYEFTNQAGNELGHQVADAVLARFALNEDTQAPAVIAQDTPAAIKTNLTLSGQILDNLSGVVSSQYRIDGGELKDLALDADGKFSITTAFAVDGSADGSHTVTILARDATGNLAAGFNRSFTLDTKAPALDLASLADGATLSATSRVAGTADPTGTQLVELLYSVDGGQKHSLSFDAATGSFDQALILGNLGIGGHTLALNARDAAGNTANLIRDVKIEALAPFTITRVTPVAGTGDVGVTYRPQVFFSREVNPNTLTADTFYATGPDGAKLDTTIVPALDGSFAWLFFDKPMPGGANVMLHLNGSAIRAQADGSFLDADGNGASGGKLSWSFTTVSSTIVANTRLVGKVVDPGPDLQPMTFDDIRRGPDGVIHTPDDVFLNPIAHAKVYIIGLEDKVVYTDANGNFELTEVPVGEVKIAVDGRTATNAPEGIFFPEMVMAAQLLPGVTNTVMGSMGSNEERIANVDRQEVYLPRVETASLQQISQTETTVVTVDDKSAPDLTDEQRSQLTLTVPPGSAVGFDGKPLDDVEIGINTVPPELIRDMMPPGLIQLSATVTIQAPGVAQFAEPLQFSFPNIYGATPGTKLPFYSFDHTTGNLTIEGTATVSADGKFAVTDEGTGIVKPGWHGVTPPGSQTVGPGILPPVAEPNIDNPCNKEIENVRRALTAIQVEFAAYAVGDLLSIQDNIKRGEQIFESSKQMTLGVYKFLEERERADTLGQVYAGFRTLSSAVSVAGNSIELWLDTFSVDKGDVFDPYMKYNENNNVYFDQKLYE
ncbi:MAG: Ig-like domain-containing protein, partial [Sinobacteraceae bacterium]|nr:Ig-like domain-containing protein [Nevskiaceae bacterium]